MTRAHVVQNNVSKNTLLNSHEKLNERLRNEGSCDANKSTIAFNYSISKSASKTANIIKTLPMLSEFHFDFKNITVVLWTD